MISTPQEIEQNAVAIANWVVYNGRPFVLPTDDGKRMYLTVLSEEELQRLHTPSIITEPEKTIEQE